MLLIVACAGTSSSTLWAGQGRRGDDDRREEGEHHGRGRGRGHEEREHRRDYEARYFRPEHRTVILNYYGGPRRLPPGLARKWERGESLPPGWEKRFRPMPVVIARELPPPCATCSMGIVDNCAVVYDRRTRIVLDVMALVGDISRP